VLQGVRVLCTIVSQCVAVYCSVLQLVVACVEGIIVSRSTLSQCVAVCCSVLQCVAAYCSVLRGM